jgi:hypothetical protein
MGVEITSEVVVTLIMVDEVADVSPPAVVDRLVVNDLTLERLLEGLHREEAARGAKAPRKARRIKGLTVIVSNERRKLADRRRESRRVASRVAVNLFLKAAAMAYPTQARSKRLLRNLK